MTDERNVRLIKKANKKLPARDTMSPEELQRERLMRAYRRYVRLTEDVKQELKEKFGVRL